MQTPNARPTPNDCDRWNRAAADLFAAPVAWAFEQISRADLFDAAVSFYAVERSTGLTSPPEWAGELSPLEQHMRDMAAAARQYGCAIDHGQPRIVAETLFEVEARSFAKMLITAAYLARRIADQAAEPSNETTTH